MTNGKTHNFIAEPTIAEDVVVTKYKMAGDMANHKPAKLGVCNVSWKGGKRRASAISYL